MEFHYLLELESCQRAFNILTIPRHSSHWGLGALLRLDSTTFAGWFCSSSIHIWLFSPCIALSQYDSNFHHSYYTFSFHVTLNCLTHSIQQRLPFSHLFYKPRPTLISFVVLPVFLFIFLASLPILHNPICNHHGIIGYVLVITYLHFAINPHLIKLILVLLLFLYLKFK